MTRRLFAVLLGLGFVVTVVVLTELGGYSPVLPGTAKVAAQEPETEAGFFAYAGGPVRAKRARTQTAPSNLAGGAAYVNLPGATLSYTVPAGTSDLFNVAFSAECTKLGGSTAYIRVLDGGVPMEPYDGFQSFCSSSLPATHKGNWARRVGAGAHTLQVQFRSPAGGVTVDDWTFELVVYD
jgi:hypothetical protein